MSISSTVTFQEALEIVESFPESQQDELVEIVRRRRLERRRLILAESVSEARSEYRRGEVRQGSVDDLLKELIE